MFYKVAYYYEFKKNTKQYNPVQIWAVYTFEPKKHDQISPPPPPLFENQPPILKKFHKCPLLFASTPFFKNPLTTTPRNEACYFTPAQWSSLRNSCDITFLHPPPKFNPQKGGCRLALFRQLMKPPTRTVTPTPNIVWNRSCRNLLVHVCDNLPPKKGCLLNGSIEPPFRGEGGMVGVGGWGGCWWVK